MPVQGLIHRYSREYPDIKYEISDSNVHDLILQSQLLITTHSTVAEEAIAMGKPAISVHAGAHINIAASAGLEINNCAHNSEELKCQIDRMLSLDPQEFEKMREHVVEQCFGMLDGKATERTADLIKEMIFDGKKHT